MSDFKLAVRNSLSCTSCKWLLPVRKQCSHLAMVIKSMKNTFQYLNQQIHLFVLSGVGVKEYYRKIGESYSKIEDDIKAILKKIDVDDTNNLTEKAKEIRDLIISAEIPKDLENEIFEAYDHFNIDLAELKDSPGALAILKSAREPIFVSVRSSPPSDQPCLNSEHLTCFGSLLSL